MFESYYYFSPLFVLLFQYALYRQITTVGVGQSYHLYSVNYKEN